MSGRNWTDDDLRQHVLRRRGFFDLPSDDDDVRRVDCIRQMDRIVPALQRRLLDPLALRVLDGAFHDGDTVVVDAGRDELKFEKGQTVPLSLSLLSLVASISLIFPRVF